MHRPGQHESKGLPWTASFGLAPSPFNHEWWFLNGEYSLLITPLVPFHPSPLSYHMMHTLTANYSWELPYFQGMGGVVEGILGGWTLNGIVTVTSGTPFTIEISDSLDNERDRSTSNESRPSLVAGASNNPVLGDPALWVDPAAFELAPAGFYGDVGRTTARGDDFANFDFSMGKNTRLGEVATLQFRAEFFNIFNQPNFRHPSRQVFSGSGRLNSSFGRVTRTDNTSRQIQFALKLLF
jgi:hypothetical protein